MAKKYGQSLHRPQSEKRITLYNISDEQLLRLKSEIFVSAECFSNSFGIKRESVKAFFLWYEDYLFELAESKGLSEEKDKGAFYQEVMALDKDNQTIIECHKHWLIQQSCM